MQVTRRQDPRPGQTPASWISHCLPCLANLELDCHARSCSSPQNTMWSTFTECPPNPAANHAQAALHSRAVVLKAAVNFLSDPSRRRAYEQVPRRGPTAGLQPRASNFIVNLTQDVDRVDARVSQCPQMLAHSRLDGRQDGEPLTAVWDCAVHQLLFARELVFEPCTEPVGSGFVATRLAKLQMVICSIWEGLLLLTL